VNIIKSLFKATVTITVFSIATRTVAFFNRIFLSRNLGAEGMGIYQVVLSVFSLLITFTSSGLPIAVSKQTARLNAANNRDGAHKTATAAAVIGVSLSLIITLFILIFKNVFSLIFADPRCMPIFTVLLPGITASAIYSAYRGGLWGQKNYFAFSVCEFIEEVLLFTICIILVSRVNAVIDGVYNAAVAITISFTASALIAVCIYFYYDGKIKNPRGFYKPIINSAAPLTGIRAASGIITSLLALIIPLRLMISGMTSSEALSEFGIASGMTLPLLFIPCTLVGSLALALMPEISGAKNKKSKQIAASIQNALIFALMVSLAIMGIYITAGKDITVFLFHNERAGELLIYSAAVMIPMSLSHMSSAILNSLGREYKSLKNYLAGAAVMLVFVWFLPEFLGIYAMILGFFFSFLITAALNIIAIKKDISNIKIFSTNLPLLLLIGCASALTCYLVNSFTKRFLPAVIALGISGTISVTVFLLFSAMFKICFTDTILGKFMPKCLTKQKK
jgi:stage V sporulation protein B